MIGAAQLLWCGVLGMVGWLAVGVARVVLGDLREWLEERDR